MCFRYCKQHDLKAEEGHGKHNDVSYLIGVLCRESQLNVNAATMLVQRLINAGVLHKRHIERINQGVEYAMKYNVTFNSLRRKIM
jgi:hypothetical protein